MTIKRMKIKKNYRVTINFLFKGEIEKENKFNKMTKKSK